MGNGDLSMVVGGKNIERSWEISYKIIVNIFVVEGCFVLECLMSLS